MLIKIHAMTGWNFPDPASAEILKEQFQKKMQEGYATVNTDEIEYAFRTYGTTVKDWGKSMNLSLIDEVMIPYLEARNSVSRLEETKQQPQIEHKEDLSDKAMRDWLEETRKKVKAGMKFDFVPLMLYDWLDKKGELAELDTKTKFRYMDAAATYLKGLEQAPTVEAVKNTAKRMILNDVILKQD
jgi:hypothetical protein